MVEIIEQEYKINICTDIIEWAKKFYDMPDGAELVNKEEVSSECMGFALIDEKKVWIFVPKDYQLQELKATISHEIGHIIEMKHAINPEQIEDNLELHEIKANYYMNFYLIVDSIVSKVLCFLENNK